MFPNTKFADILTTLANHQVAYIIVGGVCAVLNGAPLNTLDVDIVPLRTPENMAHLEAALLELKAYYREHPPGRILPQAERMDTPGHHLLMTSAGPLDVLGTIVGSRRYEDLLPATHEVLLNEGMVVRILDLSMLIRIKEETGRAKDRLALPVLRSALAEQKRIAKTTHGPAERESRSNSMPHNDETEGEEPTP